MKKIVLLTALLCLLIAFQSAFSQTCPNSYKDAVLNYSGNQQLLAPECPPNGSFKYYYWNELRSPASWDENRPVGHFPDTYTVNYIYTDKTGDELNKIKKSSSESYTVKIVPNGFPEAKEGLVYDTTKQILIKPGVEFNSNNDQYFYRIISPYTTQWEHPKNDDDLPNAINPGIYVVEYKIVDQQHEEDVYTGKLTVCIATANGYCPPNNGGNGGNSGSGSSGHYSFYTIGDGYGLFESDRSLPATGFPTRFTKPLSVKPDSVRYEDLSMRIQIPSINVDVELTGVPEIGNTWAVEWLDNKAGILSGSAMPGDGYTLVAAHNHLNTQEIGPFAFLVDLDVNDRIFVNMPDEGLKMYSVYANELLEPNDFRQMAAISEGEEGSLILITCENEMIDGGYQNRRVVFAKLMN